VYKRQLWGRRAAAAPFPAVLARPAPHHPDRRAGHDSRGAGASGAL